MKVRILGCGTSFGVPRIGNDWGECDPAEPRNRRTRSSILIESGGQRLLVDCGPDLRQQLLAAEVDRLDGVIITHDHADHCHGIDDLRAITQATGRALPIYGRQFVLDRLQTRFGYIFNSGSFYKAVGEAVPIEDGVRLGDGTLRFVDQPHGKITSLGIRVDEGSRSLAYAIDFNEMLPDMRTLYQGANIWIADCLSRRPHPTHAHLDAVVKWAEQLGVGQLYLSHLNNSMDYRTLLDELPDWAAPAFDGLEIEV